MAVNKSRITVFLVAEDESRFVIIFLDIRDGLGGVPEGVER